jgi:hypothetical protein
MSVSLYNQSIRPDWFTAVSLGQIPNVSAVSILGVDPSVGTAGETTLWQEGIAYVFPATASTMTVSSSDTNDTSAGSGGRTILIQGLDTDYLEILEFVTMNGQTAVTTANSYLRINAMTVFSSGASLKNEGNIFIGTGTVTTGKPANVYGRVSASEGISHTGVYTVPAKKRFLLVRGDLSAESGKQIEVFLDARPLVLGRTLVRGTTYDVSGQHLPLSFIPSEPYTEKTDIFITVIATGGGGAGECRADLAGILTP